MNSTNGRRPTPHQKLVGSLVKHQYLTRGIRDVLREALKEDLEHGDAELTRWLIAGGLPDAYKVDWGRKILTCVEVEVTSDIKHSKMRWYSELWFTLDCNGWDLRLEVLGKYGNHSRICLKSEWYKALAEKQGIEWDYEAPPPHPVRP